MGERRYSFESLDVPEKPMFKELAIICIDRSNSMTQPNGPAGSGAPSRYQDAITHLFDGSDSFINRLKISGNAANHYLSFVTFAKEAELVHGPRRLKPENGSEYTISAVEKAKFKPGDGSESTSIFAALQLASQTAMNWLKYEIESNDRDQGIGISPAEPYVVIILVTDGYHREAGDPLTLARTIKEQKTYPNHKLAGVSHPRIILSCAAYGVVGGEDVNHDLLKDIATNRVRYFDEPKSGVDLRDFLIRSIGG